jgi:hypothetical protein
MNVFPSSENLSNTLPNLDNYYSGIGDEDEIAEADNDPETCGQPRCRTQVIPMNKKVDGKFNIRARFEYDGIMIQMLLTREPWNAISKER